MNSRRHKQKSPWKKASLDSRETLIIDHFDTGRMLAWFALQNYDDTGRFLSEILSQVDSQHSLAPQERGLAVDVASGVVRRRRALDTLLESQISRPRSNVEPDLWRLLQLGTWQVVYSRTPEHAAVDTTVELAKRVGRERWCNFTNGVLRNIARLLSTDTIDDFATDALPIENGSYRKLNQSILPDPVADLPEYIGRAFSLPRSLARRWCSRMSRSDLTKSCFHSLKVPQITLRVNRLAATVGQVQNALQEQGVDVTPGENDWSLNLAHASRVTELPGYSEGWWSVQDDSAMLPAELLAPQPGEKILDLCAAPGGKTTHLAELSGDAAHVTACDVSEGRLHRVVESIDRLKLTNATPVLIQRDGSDIPEADYDAVLVDVPCSNTGVLSRRPEARWRFRNDEVQELVQLQTRLLLTAFDHVKSGGRIIYSTCSIEPEETSQLVESVTQQVPGLSLESQHLQLPGQPSDGAFQALLKKNS
ncbi:MAG: transcription antitermination factor NusB [Fuerstiella sp.]|nr:transcription antitermination factor NusB [Fuerstiella sp.]